MIALLERWIGANKRSDQGLRPYSFSREPRRAGDRLLSDCEQGAGLPAHPASDIRQAVERFEEAYQPAKAGLLHLGSRDEIAATSLVRVPDRMSALRRMLDQAAKAAVLIRSGVEAQPVASKDSNGGRTMLLDGRRQQAHRCFGGCSDEALSWLAQTG